MTTDLSTAGKCKMLLLVHKHSYLQPSGTAWEGEGRTLMENVCCIVKCLLMQGNAPAAGIPRGRDVSFSKSPLQYKGQTGEAWARADGVNYRLTV